MTAGSGPTKAQCLLNRKRDLKYNKQSSVRWNPIGRLAAADRQGTAESRGSPANTLTRLKSILLLSKSQKRESEKSVKLVKKIHLKDEIFFSLDVSSFLCLAWHSTTAIVLRGVESDYFAQPDHRIEIENSHQNCTIAVAKAP
jgi:hypothetical protein